MSATPPIVFDFLASDADWDVALKACRQQWSEIRAPLTATDLDFLEMKGQVFHESVFTADDWQRLIDGFLNQAPAEGHQPPNALLPYLESADAKAILNRPASFLGWSETDALRRKLDQNCAWLLQESIQSAGLREAFVGMAGKVSARKDFYRDSKAGRDRQRKRLRMSDNAPGFYAPPTVAAGTQQPAGAEPRILRQLRLLIERRARHHTQARRILLERRFFWTVEKNALREFHWNFTAAIQPPPEPEVAEEEAAVPIQPPPAEAARSAWRKLWDFLRRKKARPPAAPTMAPPSFLPARKPRPKPKPRVLGITFPILPRNRELWPLLFTRHKGCIKEVELLDAASVQMDDRLLALEARLAAILEKKSALESGVNLAQLRADSEATMLHLAKEVRICRQRIDDFGKSFEMP